MQDILGNEINFDCLGCSIVNKEIIPPGGILYETEDFLLHQDPLIPIEGFLIVTVKKHISSITELSAKERHRLIDFLSDGISLIKKLNIAEEITIIQEERSNHLHFWLFPWKPWMKGIGNYKDICEYSKMNSSKQKGIQVVEIISMLRNSIESSSDLFQ